MRRVFSLFLIMLALLTSCAPGSNNENCANGVCIKIHIAGKLQKNAAIPIEIRIKSDKDLQDVPISLSVDPGVILEDPTEKSGLTSQKENSLNWKKRLERGKELTIRQNIWVENTGYYSFSVVFGPPVSSLIRDAIHFQITEEGGAVILPGTEIPSSELHKLISATPGPSPTFLPTSTPRPLPTPEVAPSPTITPTVAAYP